ncbi:ATP-dependent nuclease [Photobacterium damselae]|uniref:ATP-dependent nuclease n=1 Tax=Photobacterium damselae TaxID=38293 RepID=UPI002543515E|nr:AAA family ATPase [Photobacterium damselae]
MENMYLSELNAKKFRQFNDFSMSFSKGLNLLVGENNAGKSSVIDAIRFTLDTTSAEWVSLKDTDFHHGSSELSITLKFEDLSPQEMGIYLEHLTNEETGTGPDRAILVVNLKAKLALNPFKKTQFIKTEFRSGYNGQGPTIDREIRDYLATTYLKPLRDSEAELSAGRSSRLSQILGSSSSLAGDSTTTERIIKLLTDASKAIQSDSAIQSTQAKITELINSLTFRGDVFSPVLNLLGSQDYEDMNDSERALALKAILEKLSLELDATGVKHGLGYSSLLFMAAELMLINQEGNHYSLLLVEEPEAHLHPQLQLKFINYLRTENSNLQCILSTHSPVLASKAPLENLILMQQGQAFPLRKGCTALNEEDYIFLEKFLDSTKANMFFATGVLLVEGIAEVVLIPQIAKLLGRPLEDYGVSLVNVSGLSRKRYAKVYRSGPLEDTKPLPIKVACLTDLDLWPSEAEDTGEEGCIGFKEKKLPSGRKKGNLHHWLNELTVPQIEEIKSKKSEFDGENVKTFISDEWTFEFCLAKYGLSEELYEVIKGNLDGYSALSSNNQERAVQIYSLIEDGKSEVSYSLANLLSRYEGRPNDLKAKLPPYIINAIEYVTEPFASEEEPA